jgi:excisionase family DNA binding protein
MSNENHPPARETYTVDEVAAVLGIGRTTAYRLTQSGQLTTIRVGTRVLIPRHAVDRMLRGES